MQPLSFEIPVAKSSFFSQDQLHSKITKIAAVIIGILGAAFALALGLPIIACFACGVGFACLTYLGLNHFFLLCQSNVPSLYERPPIDDAILAAVRSKENDEQVNRIVRQINKSLSQETYSLPPRAQLDVKAQAELNQTPPDSRSTLETKRGNLERDVTRDKILDEQVEAFVLETRFQFKETLFNSLDVLLKFYRPFLERTEIGDRSVECRAENSENLLPCTPSAINQAATIAHRKVLESAINDVKSYVNSQMDLCNSVEIRDPFSPQEKAEIQILISKLKIVDNSTECEQLITEIKNGIERILE